MEPHRDAQGFAVPALNVPQDVQTIMEMIRGEASVDAVPEGDVVPPQSDEEPPDGKPASSAPMTAARHAELLAQLTSFVQGPAAAAGDDEIGYITEDSEEDEEMGDVEAIDLDGLRRLMDAKRAEEVNADAGEAALGEAGEDSSDVDSSDDDSESSTDSDEDSSSSEDSTTALPARLAQVDMLSDGEDAAPTGPLKTEHEILEEPVGVPPFERLAEGARVILAGEVVSFIRDPGVAVWEDWRREEEAKEGKDVEGKEDKSVGEDVGKTEEAVQEEGQVEEMDSVEQAPVVDEAPAVQQEPVADQVSAADKAPLADPVVNAEPVLNAAPAVNEGPMINEEPASTSRPPTTQPVPSVTDAPVKPETETPAAPATEPSSAPAPKRARNRRGANTRRNAPGKPSGPPVPKTSGTIVLQAQRPPAGTVKGGTDRLDEDGWLLDGSVICTGEGQAVAVVAEVFGPTAQPFYLLKLPPPPFPIPSAEQLARGTKLYYPAEGDHAYVPVRMLKTDKRFKGTDASNLYDEELAEHEMEWSDDEEEQAAKRKLKADRRGKKAGEHPIGRRQPHFDTASTAGQESDEEMSVHYGGAGDSSVRDDRSEAGVSVASTSARSRRVPQSYGDLYDDQASVGYREPAGRGAARGRGRNVSGRGGATRPVSDRFGDAPPTQAPPPARNQDGGRQIGRGAGRGRGVAERGRGRGQATRGGAQQGRRQAPSPHVAPASANLPARPRDLSPTSAHIARVTGAVQTPLQQPPAQPQQAAFNGMMGMSPFGWNPQAAGMPMPMGMGMFPPPFFMPMQPGASVQPPAGAGMPGVNPGFMQQYQQVKEQYQQMVARYQGHQGQGQPPPGQGGM